MNSAAEKLIEVGKDIGLDEEIKTLEKEVELMNERWRNVNRNVSEKLHRVVVAEGEMDEFQECVKTLQIGVNEIITSMKDALVFDMPEEDDVQIKDIKISGKLTKDGDVSADLKILNVSF